MDARPSPRLLGGLLAAAIVGGAVVMSIAGDEHSVRDYPAATYGAATLHEAQQAAPPPSNADAMARLTSSPRHGEWVIIQLGKNATTGTNDSTRAWIVFPGRPDKAPVVVVIHEIFGLSPWVRAMTDQLAADGFIAIAPDFITMKKVPGNPVDGPDQNLASPVIRALASEEVNRQIDAVARYAMALPAATQKYGVVGYCWGGAASFNHAIHSPSLGAAVVYYGRSPAPATASSIRAPVLGLYGSNDAGVNQTIPPVDSALKALGKSFAQHVFEGAGHGFLRQQTTQANLDASRKAWPLTVQFFRTHLEAR